MPGNANVPHACAGYASVNNGTRRKPHPVTVLAAYGRQEVIDGPTWKASSVILEFPTFEAVNAWYNSPAYEA